MAAMHIALLALLIGGLGGQIEISGDYLTTLGVGFGAMEPNSGLRAASYGTEGQRFESSRARTRVLQSKL
jgi:hypothetical protein